METYESAKSYYFFGIPKRDGGGREILRPSLQDVAQALGASLADIGVIADREHWVERRERLLLQIRAFEGEEVVHKTLAWVDSTVITNAALGLKKIDDNVRGLSEELTPIKTLAALKALDQAYRTFKRPFGRTLPVLGSARPEDSPGFEDHLSTPSGVQGRSRHLSLDSINQAKRAFFLGLRDEGQTSLTMKPSVRQVAESLNLPTRPLQRIAVQQQWVAARRESDRWGGGFRAERVAHQVGRETLFALVWKFYKVAMVVGGHTTRLWERHPNMSMRDVRRIVQSTNLFLRLLDEVVRDYGTLTGYATQATPGKREEALAHPSAVRNDVADPEPSSWHDIMARALRSMAANLLRARGVQPEGGLGSDGFPEVQESIP